MPEKACLFCKIAAKELSPLVVGEDDHAIAFLDVHPHAPGHTMVISKTHSASLVDLPETEVAPLFAMVRRMDERLTQALKADGMTIGINQGEVSGQSVQHLHIHLLPRFTGDGGSSIHSVVNNPSERTLEEMVEKITSQK